MKTYPRYRLYELFNVNHGCCTKCNSNMDIRDLEVSNVHNDTIWCSECIASNFPKECKHSEQMFDFKFSKDSLFVKEDLEYVKFANEEVEEESNLDPEEKIQSSWYHRAILGDENREIYTDGQDTDFEAVEAHWHMMHCNEDDDEDEQNSQILGLEFAG